MNSSVSATFSNNLLTVTSGGVSEQLSVFVAVPQGFMAAFPVAADGFGGTDVTLVFTSVTSGPIVVSNGQIFTISGGESESGVTVLNGGTLIALSGGIAVNTADSGLEVLSGGRDIGGAVASGGVLQVSGGGVASTTMVASGGLAIVLSGGSTVSATLIGNGPTMSGAVAAQETVSSGGVASGTTVSSGGRQLVLDGGVTVGTVVSGGVEVVSSGGAASGATVNGGGFQYVEAGGATSATTVLGGGLAVVSAGGTARGTVIDSSGTEIVSAGGNDFGAMVSGLSFASGAAVQDVYGTATGAMLGAGGVQVVEAGGLAVATTVGGGGLSGVQDVFGTASGTIIASGGQDDIALGGVTLATTVLAGGFEFVLSTGTASGTVIASGGSALVSSGGSEVDATISGGTLELAAGASAGGTIGFAGVGGVLQIDGTAMPGAVIAGFVPGDIVALPGIAGGSGGSVSLDAGNVLSVHEGGSTFALQLDPAQNYAGETFVVLDDGSGGTDIVLYGSAVVGPGQTLVLSAGQTVSNLTVLPGGTLQVGSGATASGVVVESGGNETVGSGGVDIGATVASGGFQDLFGTASGTVIIAGGSQTVEPGGTASGTVLDDAAVQDVFGFAGGTVVSASDTQIVESGGTASGTTISSGGSEIVLSGGLTIDTTIAAGTLALAVGADTGGTIAFAGTGGVLEIDGAAPGVPIAGFVFGDVIDLRSLMPSAGNTVSFDPASGTLTVGGGGTVDTLILTGIAAGTGFSLAADGQGGTLIEEVALAAPANLALAAASDSGVAGDDITNVTIPVITGTGVAGDTVTLFDGNTPVGSGTVLADGSWAVGASALSGGTHSLTASQQDGAGNVSALSAALSLVIDLTAPVATAAALTVNPGAGPTPIGIAAPSDPDNPAGALTVMVTALPGDGTVTLADGTTAVSLGETLTVAQLTGLDFTAGANQAGTSGSFGYTVTDPAGNTATGNATLTVAAAATAQLFDFVFLYNDGKDYYYGKVSDDGTYGYQVGETINATAGQYLIYANEGATSAGVGTITVYDYSHGGPGQASSVPLDTAAHILDGLQGLGSESDAVLGTDGQAHAFSSTLEASFPTIALFGFVYTYADGRAFYSGTVADDGSLSVAPGATITKVVGGAAGTFGTYTIFNSGVTTRAPGTVVIDRYTTGGMSVIPDPGSMSGVDGTQGLGSEVATLSVDGVTASFSDQMEAAVSLTIPTVPTTPPPSMSDVITAELNELYREVLGRNADSSGLATYSMEIANGTSLASIRQILAQSPEAQNDLNGLYNQVFGRNADAGGLATYTGELTDGSSLNAVLLLLAQSPEAQSDLGQIYTEVLGRPADGGGLTTYMASLAQGTSIAGVRDIVAHSPEAQNDLTSLFATIIGRAPDTAELVGMEDLLGNGQTQQTLQGALSSSGSAGGFATLTAGSGDAALTAQPGTPTLFVFDDITFGHDTIAGFDPSRDTIQLSPALVPDLATLTSDTAAVAGGTLITLNPSQSILLSGVAQTSLAPGNFHIA